MRKGAVGALMMTLCLLTACGGERGNEAETLAVNIRARYLEAAACTAHGELTADYGERVFTYGVDMTWAKEGETRLTITSPEEVAGVSAVIAAGETALEFDGVMVETGPLDSEGLSPIDALPALLACAREGFMAEIAMEERESARRLHVTCRDPEKSPGEGTETQLWFEPETGALLRGEISSDGFTVIQCDFTHFTLEESVIE